MYYHEFIITVVTDEKLTTSDGYDILDQVSDIFCMCPEECPITIGSSRINMTEADLYDTM